MQRIAAVAAALVVAVGLGATWYVTQSSGSDPFAQCRSSRVAGQADIGGPFELVNAEGRTVTDADVITEPTLIYFGYTFCPDVCPLDAARNADVIDVLAERGISATPVFISIDPERDTPEVMGDFAEILHDKMIGLTGSLDQVDAASKAYRTYYKRHDSEDEFYLVDHSSLTYLVLPEVGFVDVFRRDLTAEVMADTVACFAEAA
jgi:protein SCO1/2